MADMVCGRYRRNSSLNWLYQVRTELNIAWNVMATTWRSAPDELCLGANQLQPVIAHPSSHVVDAVRHSSSERGITTILATNHIGHDHIGHRRNRCPPPRRCHHVSSDVQLGPDLVQLVQSARDVGVFVTMRTRINNVLSSSYGSPRQIRTIKRSLPVTLSTPSSQALYTMGEYIEDYRSMSHVFIT